MEQNWLLVLLIYYIVNIFQFDFMKKNISSTIAKAQMLIKLVLFFQEFESDI